jgi:hypothetical protein
MGWISWLASCFAKSQVKQLAISKSGRLIRLLYEMIPFRPMSTGISGQLRQPERAEKAPKCWDLWTSGLIPNKH